MNYVIIIIVRKINLVEFGEARDTFKALISYLKKFQKNRIKMVKYLYTIKVTSIMTLFSAVIE